MSELYIWQRPDGCYGWQQSETEEMVEVIADIMDAMHGSTDAEISAAVTSYLAQLHHARTLN